MVYLYAFIGRLALYPYLMYRTSRLLPSRIAKFFYLGLIIEFIISTLGLITHHFIMHPVMSSLMSANLFIFFSAGYASGMVILLNLLRKGLSYYTPIYDNLSLWIRRSVDWVVALAWVGLFFSLMYVGYHNVADLKRTHLSLQAIPRLERPLRIALLTDIHIGEGITESFVRQMVMRTMAERPDLILIGGDYIDHYGKYAYDEEMSALMRQLKAPEGVYYVAGNHEYRADSIEKLAWVGSVGGRLLLDEVVPLRDSTIMLIGRNDWVHDYERKPLSALTAGIRPEQYTILLEHTPEGLDSLEHSPIDLALYGHTHAGQLYPNNYVIRLKYNHIYGQKMIGKTLAYVSSGAGSAGAPYRIGTRSEYVIIDIQ